MVEQNLNFIEYIQFIGKMEIQGRRNEFELKGAKNRQLVNSRQGEEKFWSEKLYFYYKVLRLKDKSPQKLRKSTKLDKNG